MLIDVNISLHAKIMLFLYKGYLHFTQLKKKKFRKVLVSWVLQRSKENFQGITYLSQRSTCRHLLLLVRKLSITNYCQIREVQSAVFLTPFCIVCTPLRAFLLSVSSSLCSCTLWISPSSSLSPYVSLSCLPAFPLPPLAVWSWVAAAPQTPYSVFLNPYGFDHLIIEIQCLLFTSKADINIFIENQSNSLTLWILCCCKWQKRPSCQVQSFQRFYYIQEGKGPG